MEPLKTVAFADDEPGILQVLKLSCELKYKIVGTAKNGEEAIALVKAKRPDVLILDVHMPVLDGLEALKQIAALKTTAVVILTADQDPAVARAAMDLGASAYMTKPFEFSQVVSVLESAWHHHQIVTSLKEQARSLSETLENRKLLDKAKGILMEQQGFSEETAHKTLLKMSQDQGILLKDLCRSVIHLKTMLGKGAGKPSLRPAA